MHILLKSQVLRCGQRHAGRADSLDSRIICQVDKQNRAVDGTGLTEGLLEEVCLLEGDAHGREDHCEGLIRAAHLSLPRDLRRELGVGKARC